MRVKYNCTTNTFLLEVHCGSKYRDKVGIIDLNGLGK